MSTCRCVWFTVAMVGAMGSACGSQVDLTTLSLAPDTTQLVNDGSQTTLRLQATTAKGEIGSGTVDLSTEAGTLESTQLVLDKYGTARTSFVCDVAVDPACSGRVKVTAKWQLAGKTISGESVITLVPPATPPLVLRATNCTQVNGVRPASTGSTAAPRVSSASLSGVTPGQPLGGSVTFSDDQNDEASVIVELNGEGRHHVCPLSASELAAKTFALSRLSLTAGFKPGSYILYVGVKDQAGNVSGYTAVTLVVGTGGAFKICDTSQGASKALQLTGSAPSASTLFYTNANGTLPTYALQSATGDKMTIVYSAVVQLDIGTCTKLLVSADAAGSAAPGWDNCLLAEVRERAGGPVAKQWAYCSTDTPSIFGVASGATVATPLAPTIAGNSLTPQVPSAQPFGYPPRAIDLMSQIPSGLRNFELSLYVLDFGEVGSTTEVWVQPE